MQFNSTTWFTICNDNAFALHKITYRKQCKFNALHYFQCSAEQCLSFSIAFQCIVQITMHYIICNTIPIDCRMMLYLMPCNSNALHNCFNPKLFNSNTLQNDGYHIQCNPNAFYKSTDDCNAILMHFIILIISNLIPMHCFTCAIYFKYITYHMLCNSKALHNCAYHKQYNFNTLHNYVSPAISLHCRKMLIISMQS